MNGNIRHQGIIDKISKNGVKVRIVQSSACSSCQMSGHCNASESKVKMIDVPTFGTEGVLHVGDDVMVVATQRSGLVAVVLSAVVPLVLIILSLTLLLRLTGNEALAALGGIATLIPYYIILYLLRDKISRSVSFHIERSA